jgi:hypothetical protein
MALIYPDLAILPVGMSCQAAQQVYGHKPLIDSLMGEPGHKTSTPLNWLIAPAPAAATILETGLFFPGSLEAMERHGTRFFWRETGTWYWHVHDLDQNFDNTSAKFDYMAGNFDRLSGRRILAVWTNAQANLGLIARRHADVDILARQGDLKRLEAALRGRLGERVTLAAVLHPGRDDPDDPPDWPTSYRYFSADPPRSWRGDAQAWGRILHRALSDTLGDRIPPAPVAEQPVRPWRRYRLRRPADGMGPDLAALPAPSPPEAPGPST